MIALSRQTDRIEALIRSEWSDGRLASRVARDVAIALEIRGESQMLTLLLESLLKEIEQRRTSMEAA